MCVCVVCLSVVCLSVMILNNNVCVDVEDGVCCCENFERRCVIDCGVEKWPPKLGGGPPRRDVRQSQGRELTDRPEPECVPKAH